MTVHIAYRDTEEGWEIDSVFLDVLKAVKHIQQNPSLQLCSEEVIE